MKRFLLAIVSTLIFNSFIFTPAASADQICADGFRSTSKSTTICTKHGGVAPIISKTKTTINSDPVNAAVQEPISSNEVIDKSRGKIPGLCSRINRYAPGTC